MTVNLKVDIQIKGNDASLPAFKAVIKNAQDAAKAAQKSGLDVGKTITAISTAWLAFGRQAVAAISAPIREANKAEQAGVKLATALKATGQFTDAAYQSMIDYADQLERMSGLESESIQGIQTRAISLKFTRDQTMALADASVILAKRTGDDVATASDKLIASLNGQDRALRGVVPGITQLTEAQKRAGGAITLVQDQLRQFVQSDTATTAGAWMRISTAVGNFAEAIGDAFIKGANLPGHLDDIVKAFERMIDVVSSNDSGIKGMASTIVSNLVPALEKAVTWTDNWLKKLNGIDWGELKENFTDWARDKLGVKDEWRMPQPDLAKDQAEFDRIMEYRRTGVDPGSQGEMVGPSRDMMFVGPMPTVREGGGAAIGGTVGAGANAPRFKGRAPFSDADEAKARGERAREAQIKINEMLAEENGRAQSQAAQNLQRHLIEITKLEETAAKGGVNVSKQAETLRLAAHKQFVKDWKEESAKKDKEEIDQWYETQRKLGQLMGDETAMIRNEYHEQVRDLDEALAKSLISYEQYVKRKAELEAQSDERQFNATTGKTLGKIQSVVAAAQGGLNSIITTIGNMAGPIGSLVAQVITFLNQTPEEFRAMIRSLIDEIKNLPKFIATNIPILIAEIIRAVPDILASSVSGIVEMTTTLAINSLSAALETLPQALGKIFSAGFWGSIVNGLFNALRNAFRNFFELLFTGKPLHSALEDQQQAAQREAARFGSDDPNAGDGEFKIKDEDLRNRRRAGTFEDTFKETVDQGGKSFTDLLKQAFMDLLKDIEKFFLELPGKIWSGFLTFLEEMKKFGAKVWDGLVEAGNKAIAWIQKVGQFIWDGLVAAGTAAITALAAIGKLIWDGLLAAGTAAVKALGALGKFIWDGLIAAGEAYWDALEGFGRAIWRGFRDAVKNAIDTVKGWGEAIFKGFKAMFTSQYWKDLGGYIWSGLKTALTEAWDWIGGVGRQIGYGVTQFLKESWDWIGGVGRQIGYGVTQWLSESWDWLGGVGRQIGHGITQWLYEHFDWLSDLFGSAMGGGGGGNGGIEGTGTPLDQLNKGGVAGTRNPTMAAIFAAAGVQQFAGGGVADGVGFQDTVPALLTPGEPVLSRDQAKAMGIKLNQPQTTVNIDFNIAAGARVDREAVREMMPQIIELLRRETRNGTLAIRQSGVF